MSSISLFSALLVAATGPVPGTACPASNGGARFTGGQVYDGPVEENAILKPDEEHRVRGVTIAAYPLDYVLGQGRPIFLTCDYANKSSLVVRVNRSVKVCRYSYTRRRESLACR